MEIIKIDLENKNIDMAYSGYIDLFKNNKLDNLYQSAIAIHGSYSFLNTIENFKKISNESKNDLTIKINNLLSYVDNKIISYEGPRLEILFLLSVFNTESIDEESQTLFDQIQANDKISSSIKERVKKIHEFQKYK